MPIPFKTVLIAAGAVPVLLFAAGCVPQEKYNALRIEKEALESQINEAQSAKLTAEERERLLQQQLDATSGGAQGFRGLIENKDREIAQLRQENQALAEAYRNALESGGPALPAPVVTDLNRFAQANPGLVSFDERTGVIRFASDLTFGSGSATLNPEAANALSQFAGILNNPSIADYELMVAGHTDNVPVTNPATKQRHPDNWYLSAHRAISVAEALRRDGVAKNRIAVAGFADQRPVANNDTTAGKAANRRVEVLILPTKAPTTTGQDLPTPVGGDAEMTESAPADTEGPQK